MRFWKRWLLRGLLGTASSLLMAVPAQATQKVYLSLGLLEISVSVSALEAYAKEGTLTGELGAYTRYLNEEQKAEFRELLTTGSDLDAIAIAQFLYSPQGETLLKQLGEIIDTKQRQGGFYAIRSALILAAADEEGLTLLNFLKHFPTEGLRINSEQGLELFNQFTEFVQETEQAVALIERQAQTNQDDLQSVTNSNLADLRVSGKVAYQRQSLKLVDKERGIRQANQLETKNKPFSARVPHRELPTELYLPKKPKQQSSPLIVISHGLGSDRHTYRYLAQHLASYGFAVAQVEHPGSSASYLQSLLQGLQQEVSPPLELINRPLDIQYVLDYLEQNYQSAINFDQVGLLGQSYGAYTSLALGGASVDYDAVTKRCKDHETAAVLNVSLLLQCQLSQLSKQDYDFQDSRIQAVFAINPFTSHIFAEQGLKALEIPTLFVSGSADTVTPALTEQIRPFSWLDHADKYLVLLKQGTHFSTIPEPEEEGLPIPPEIIGPDPSIAQNYIKALSTAFFQTHLANNEAYRIYLSSEYTNEMSRALMPIFLLQELNQDQLSQNQQR